MPLPPSLAAAAGRDVDDSPVPATSPSAPLWRASTSPAPHRASRMARWALRVRAGSSKLTSACRPLAKRAAQPCAMSGANVAGSTSTGAGPVGGAAAPPAAPPAAAEVGGVGVSTCSSSSCAGRGVGTSAGDDALTVGGASGCCCAHGFSDEIAGMSKGFCSAATCCRASGAVGSASRASCSHLGVPSSSDAYEP